MNQGTRCIRKVCAVCRKNTVWVRQIYDPHYSDWVDDGIFPICDECRKHEEEIICLKSGTGSAGKRR